MFAGTGLLLGVLLAAGEGAVGMFVAGVGVEGGVGQVPAATLLAGKLFPLLCLSLFLSHAHPATTHYSQDLILYNHPIILTSLLHYGKHAPWISEGVGIGGHGIWEEVAHR